jgi:hypothetical protein
MATIAGRRIDTSWLSQARVSCGTDTVGIGG